MKWKRFKASTKPSQVIRRRA